MPEPRPYSAEQLKKDATSLARTGEWLPLRSTLVYGIIGLLIGSWGAAWTNNGGTTLLGTIVFAAYGYLRGKTKAKLLRVQADTALRLLELEQRLSNPLQ